MYSLDTSVFMDWQARYYPVDVFDTLRVQIPCISLLGLFRREKWKV